MRGSRERPITSPYRLTPFAGFDLVRRLVALAFEHREANAATAPALKGYNGDATRQHAVALPVATQMLSRRSHG